jgi:F0F1-type ATP synthase membrane subunit b/b'
MYWDNYGEDMTGELTREEVSARLEAIFSSSLEGEELQKALASVEKRLDKFEGKWGGLIKWAEQKYGKPEGSEQASQEETEQEGQKDSPPDQSRAAVDTAQEDPGEMSREVAASKMKSIFRSNLDGEELDKMIQSIDKRLDKFEGKWPKLILWAEEKYGLADSEEEGAPEVDESPQESSGIEETLELIIGGDSEAALHNLKSIISKDPSDSDAWNAFSSYYSTIGFSGRAKACEEKAQSLS